MLVTRGDIFIADLDPVVGSEQGGVRPVVIVQNDRGNRFSPTVVCAAMTSRLGKADLPTHVWVSAHDSGLPSDSLVLCEQIRTIGKSRLRRRAGRIEGLALRRVDDALLAALGIMH
ncbi:MAG: type II toxin-antitoxin system PemK/MazF family toxin [Clostridia bacterium]|nr:type II toxin-antitoxin system PemK/MazF family toxin [Clostridia bacterium]